MSARILRAKRGKKRQSRGDFSPLDCLFDLLLSSVSTDNLYCSGYGRPGLSLPGNGLLSNLIVSNQILLSLMASLPGRDTLGRIAYFWNRVAFLFACFRSVKGRAVVFFVRARPIGVQARCAFRQTAATRKKSPPASMPP